MKHIILTSLLAIFGSTPAFAMGMSSSWIGALVGQQKQDNLKPLSYGVTVGTKGLLFGAEALFLTGSKKVNGIDESITQIGGRFDLFPAFRYLYIGPELSYVTSKASVTSGGLTSAVSSSGLLYGGAAGINIPFAVVSIGGEVSYVTGKQDGNSTNVLAYVGTLKLWF
jgi:hypothetical protein